MLDRRATKLFEHCSSLISDQIYDGRFFDPTTTAAIGAVQELTKGATGTVTVGGAERATRAARRRAHTGPPSVHPAHDGPPR